MKSRFYFFSIVILTVVFAVGLHAQALEAIGGPYTADSNTVLLLHFDGNMANAAAALGKTDTAAVRNTTSPSKIYFLNNTGVAGMGQCVRLDNGAITDSTYLTVADTAAFDMQGSWTIEAWANIFTFGDASNDYRWVPRVVMKPGVDVFWHPNYWLEMWGDNRLFHAGYYAENDAFVSVSSENNMFAPGQWVHLTFIRDASRGIIAQMVHDVNKNLLSFTAAGFNPGDIPKTNINPIHIGWAGAKVNASPSGDSWLDGFLDEIRISKVVRNFAGPPLITNVTRLANQPATATGYTVNAKIQPFNLGGTITSAKLHYYTTQWDSLTMTGAGVDFSGTIPARPSGSQIKYFVTAMDNNGMRSVVPLTAEKPSNPQYYTFYIFEPNSQTLWLTFEEGTGNMPIDHSPNNSVITAKRIPTYSTIRKQGNASLYLFYPRPDIDSGWVEAASPFLAAEEFCLDFWLRADTTQHASRIINYAQTEADWNNNNFEVSFRNNAQGRIAITGRYSRADNLSMIALQDTNATQFGQWYHVVYERSSVAGKVALSVRDSNDVLKYLQVTDAPVPPIMGGSVGPATMRIGRAYTDPSNWWYIPPFRGHLDNVQLYNYAKAGITDVSGPIDPNSPWTFELKQNYPNPFNPSTQISFTIPSALQTQLVVYDLLGRKVKTLMNENLHAGQHFVRWEGNSDTGFGVASGVYFARLTAGQYEKTMKMMLMR